MSVREFGAVCDVSVLTDRESLERARRLFNGGLYLPSATYSWLARDRLINVRNRTVSYSLVSQRVRDRELLVVYLPELYDEIARRLLFAIEREVPLTDLRALLLATHLRLPLVTFDDQFVDHLLEHLGAQVLWQLNAHADWLVGREVLQFYRELSTDAGSYLFKRVQDRNAYDGLINELRRSCENSLKAVAHAVERFGQTRTNPGELNFKYLVWDLTPIVREYLEQHVLQPETVRELCERVLVLVAGPR
jgi:hypothetical protein